MSPVAAIMQVAASMLGYNDLHERGAIVYELNGQQIVETARSTALAQLHFPVPAGAKVEAMVHTHYHDCRFSEADIDTADRLDIPSYIVCNGSVTLYQPGLVKVEMAPPEGMQNLPYRFAWGLQVDANGAPLPIQPTKAMVVLSKTPRLCGAGSSHYTYLPCS